MNDYGRVLADIETDELGNGDGAILNYPLH